MESLNSMIFFFFLFFGDALFVESEKSFDTFNHVIFCFVCRPLFFQNFLAFQFYFICPDMFYFEYYLPTSSLVTTFLSQGHTSCAWLPTDTS